MTSMQRWSRQSRSRIRARCWLVALAAIAGTIVFADAASAQPINGRGRWCETFSQYGGTLNCAYNSLEQCMASAAGVSNQCSLNPWYAGPPEPAPRRRDQRRWRD